MAEAYHYEALRKQRVLDRAAEARSRMEAQKKRYADKAVQVDGDLGTATSKQSPCKQSKSSRRGTHLQKRAETILRDLHKQEMILRDSNLVMGPISLEEELKLIESTKRKHHNKKKQ